MKDNINTGTQTDLLVVPAFGYELIREVLLYDLLGKDTPNILYWAGKHLARKYPLQDLLDIIEFFQKAGWGQLTLIKEAKHEMEFELTSELIQNRMNQKEDTGFQLEAGFLAQQIERYNGCITEAFEQPKRRNHHIQITVKWDPKDTI